MIIKSWLPIRTTYDPEAVEKLFCLPFKTLGFKISQESKDAQNIIETTDIDRKITSFQRWVVDEMAERMDEFMSVTMHEEAILYIALMCDSVMTAKMYLTFIQYWCRVNEVKDVTYDLVKNFIFKTGFPPHNQLKDLWGKQKVNGSHSDDLLDYRAAMRSILF